MRNSFLKTILILFFGSSVCTTFFCMTSCERITESNSRGSPDSLISPRLHKIIPVAEQFDFPVGDINGGGSYKSTIDDKEYFGWYVSVSFLGKNEFGLHPGEDWNGKGAGNTDALQPVYAIATGEVVSIDTLPFSLGKAVMIKHIYKENDNWDTIYSVYVHLNDVSCNVGDSVKCRQTIGHIFKGTERIKAHLHFEIRKSVMSRIPLLFYPSVAGKDKDWISANYYDPQKFISSHRTIMNKK